jgi:hypothetical protein
VAAIQEPITAAADRTIRDEVLPLDFMGQGALIEPVDRDLHDRAVDYCRREIVGDVNLTKFTKVWVVLHDGDVCGLAGFVWRIDVPVFRTSGDFGARAAALLIDRMRSFFQDNGARGAEVFVHISSKEMPEQRCPKWQESLDAVNAKPADRMLVKV